MKPVIDVDRVVEEMKSIEFTDRYDALGIPKPNPSTICQGLCEGSGIFPLHKNDPDFKNNHKLRRLWRKKHKQCGSRKESWKALWLFIKLRKFRIVYDMLKDYKNWIKCDGWHFIKCPDCNGTGIRMQKGINVP